MSVSTFTRQGPDDHSLLAIHDTEVQMYLNIM
jgi:hypothetical protein